ncbi:MarR family winged helix-turn-helix transcriptional regulator [Actinomadura sp. BRA 177]|uniref:MarR family winged helix-turn-helix transcriptional regulator n=1 Tax=Actinomadura sp. BRA 177 TaxID=2745202 RepID=UPI0015960092|nr:MarR family transcriptional regulator [Actinomadura sp. BRA 177]NVI91245.1 MarR family transcriptional regulator [Actinomadura sp. BRA 177]
MTTTGGRSALTYEEEAAWLALLFSHATVMARVEAALADRHGISFSTCEILCRLAKAGPTSVRTLAGELVSVSPSRASRVIQELVNEGHLRRQAVQNDGRISLISLTPSGRRYTAAVQKTFAAVAYEHFVAPLDETDLANMRRIWDKLCLAVEPRDRAGSTNESIHHMSAPEQS